MTHARPKRCWPPLDVPYVAAQPVEFQTLEEWEASERGLHPIETTMMIAIPEIDGATGSIVFGGRYGAEGGERSMRVHAERAAMLATRVSKLVALRQAREERSPASRSCCSTSRPMAAAPARRPSSRVFESLFNTLQALKRDGYAVEVPATVDALRDRILKGNAERFGTDANVHCRIPADDHVRREPHLAEIEAQWGPAPGRQQSDSGHIHVLGERFGNVFVGIQPAFGYEGDPMRLLFERNFSPTHAFSAFYRYLREDFGAHAVLHFGTHGALEFMPGKQSGMSQACWPDRLIGDLPNLYLYAANNPSEGTIAKRRAGATLISYLTPPLAQAGLYRGLVDLKSSIERWRGLSPDASERDQLAVLVQAQAAAVDLAPGRARMDRCRCQHPGAADGHSGTRIHAHSARAACGGRGDDGRGPQGHAGQRRGNQSRGRHGARWRNSSRRITRSADCSMRSMAASSARLPAAT